MIELDSHSNTSNDDFKKMFPGWVFIRRHFFEIAALAVPLIGIVGFAAGTSFVDGWNKAAGISSNLFPIGVNETILLGLKLERPWEYSGGIVAFAVAYLYLTEVFSEWERAKWGRESHWLRWKRKKLAKAASVARKVAGVQGRLTDQSNREWKKLGPRRRWGLHERKKSWNSKRWQRFSIRAVALPLFLFAIGIALLFIFLLKAFIIEEARAEGVRAYAQLYLAVTGKLPLNFEDKITEARLREFTCLGRERLWEYRSVISTTEKGETGEEAQAYIIHSTDKLFFVIDELGSSLRSYGDAAFSLRESSNRPLSTVAKQCK
ncbi:hypothetical protein D3C81_156420 [compost metagenome]